ncbi:sodium:solute symporter [Oceanimonas sp. MB9]|uniref:sodium:solute symporter family protein n=1 Tax=Oceanimonas sp. MB9 TaxID=2588453 RepID=UPI0013F67878|nr:sodium:solute symporter family protein [Oceanimonas sp. MB9]NHI00416.1 Osmoregulated proline transporter OpuE [Oceanimonas sp. MB9]
MSGINWLTLAVIGGFFAAMLFIGYLSSKKMKTSADFLIGGRNFGMLTVTATQCASAFGGGMMIAHVGIGYKWGFSELAYSSIAIPIGGMLLAFVVAKWLRKQDFYTTTDWMCHQYGDSKVLRVVSSCVVMMVTMGWWVAQPVAAGKILNLLTGLPLEWGIIISAVVVMLYTMGGGIMAVAYTDVAQLILMLIAVFIILPLAINNAGGLDVVFASVPSENLSIWAAGDAVVWGWMLSIIPGQLVLQIYHQRIYAAKTEAIARNSMVIKSIASAGMGVWAALLGMSIYTMNSGLEDKEQAMTWALMELLPEGVAILMVGAIVAAIVSTADSALHSTVSSITRDIYHQVLNPKATDRQILRFTKACVLVVGVTGIVIGIYVPAVFKILLMGYTLTASGLLIPLYAGRLWQGGTAAGAIAGMVTGVSAAFVCSSYKLLTFLPAVVWGVGMSAVVFVAVSLMTQPGASRLAKANR